MAEMKPTAKMKKGVKLIQDNLGIMCTDKSFEGVKKFLDENLSKLEGVDFREKRQPSEKQMKGVAFIEKMLNVEFTGSSMKDASDFLDEHFEEAQAKAAYFKEHKK